MSFTEYNLFTSKIFLKVKFSKLFGVYVSVNIVQQVCIFLVMIIIEPS